LAAPCANCCFARSAAGALFFTEIVDVVGEVCFFHQPLAAEQHRFDGELTGCQLVSGGLRREAQTLASFDDGN